MTWFVTLIMESVVVFLGILFTLYVLLILKPKLAIEQEEIFIFGYFYFMVVYLGVMVLGLLTDIYFFLVLASYVTEH